MIDDATQTALLIDTHREIRDVAIKAARSLAKGQCEVKVQRLNPMEESR